MQKLNKITLILCPYTLFSLNLQIPNILSVVLAAFSNIRYIVDVSSIGTMQGDSLRWKMNTRLNLTVEKWTLGNVL